jgi:predicted GNAT superfamily acetyltransferase
MAITINPVTTIEACRVLEQLQVDIWKCCELDVVPDHALFTLAKEGNIVLLARDGEQPVGFAFGFLGFEDDGRLKYASHMVGVLPAYQNQGVGYQLKLAQREALLARNIGLMTWTFDPLQTRNARFNLYKLGAVCNTYHRNLYGDMRDGLNQGLPSDRFRADWWMRSRRVVERITGQSVKTNLVAEYPVLNPATVSQTGLLVPCGSVFDPADEFCWVQIPPDINMLKAQDNALALAWRMQTRHLFEQAFARNYTAVDLVRRGDNCYYLLQKNWQLV